MAVGMAPYIGEVNQGDTVALQAALTEQEVPIDPNSVITANFTVQKPDGTFVTVAGNVDANGYGNYLWTDTTQIGEYRAVATFTLNDLTVKSVVIDFHVEDPFADVSGDPTQMLVDEVWLRLEDTYDSMIGGPVLRDWSRNHFDKQKITSFVYEVLGEINVQMPQTQAMVADFTTPSNDGTPNPNLFIIVKGLLLRTVKHLVRSYIEIPVATNNPAPYEDRTRYWQAWERYYESEYQEWLMDLRLWKRQFLFLGHSKLLVNSKAGRVWPGATYRSRNIGRYGW